MDSGLTRGGRFDNPNRVGTPSRISALPSRRVVLIATPSAQSLEVSGPVEVFAKAEQKLREAGRERAPAYSVEIVSATDDLAIRSDSGLTILASRSYAAIDYEIDTLLVAGGLQIWSGAKAPNFLQWLRRHAPRARRFGSVCTGAFVLAEAGLLNGKRVTTHWSFCQQLQDQYPKVVVDSQPIFVRHGSIYTSAGVASGIDLALAMVEEDLGLDIALRIARALVLFVRRSSGQNQFSTALAFQASERIPLRELPIYVIEHLKEPLTIENLAKRVCMSLRNFSRVFAEEFGETPANFVEQLRLETARRLVEESVHSLDEIAEECGLGSVETLRRLFKRHFRTTPAKLRRDGRTP
jgi:transcriptional regulator GlxA family with amidase domain